MCKRNVLHFRYIAFHFSQLDRNKVETEWNVTEAEQNCNAFLVIIAALAVPTRSVDINLIVSVSLKANRPKWQHVIIGNC